MAKARANGRMVETVTMDQIDTGHLVRDRLFTNTDDMDALIASLKARGQQTPIEVIDRGEKQHPRYGLISGWRRVAALKSIDAEDVLALIRQPKTSSDAYVAMVEENEIRSDISFYERARIVVKSLEQGVYADSKTALQTLFANVSRAKRSKIKSFMVLVEALDGMLHFPSALSERNGLELVKRLNADASLLARLKLHLQSAATETPDQELTALLEGSSPQVITTLKKKAAKPAPMQSRVAVAFNANSQEINLTGAAIDEAFVADLTAWIEAREASKAN
jgi:ParB/RepB/Spo0J family partition protein